MFVRGRKLFRFLFTKLSMTLFVFGGLLFGRAAERTLSVPERIAAVQKAVEKLPASLYKPPIFRHQWGNQWANWNNWNNWANWLNWNNWSNWGNWRN